MKYERRTIRFVTVLAGLAAVLSIVAGFFVSFYRPDLSKFVGYPIVAAWAVLPPLWFWFEWLYLSPPIDHKDEREHVKYLQELARNFWIALVILLAVLFGINWKP